jgi:Fur family transcriptional regulator, stress-responsive regulator
MDTGSMDPAAALCRVGLRATASRLAVFRALAASAPRSSVGAVVSAVRERLGDGSAQTVYNVLRTFTDIGLVRRIKPAGRPPLYELRVGDTPCLMAADDSGYEIDEAEVIYWGRYPECVAATPVSSGELKRTSSVRHQPGDTALDPEQPRSRAMSHQQETAREEKDRRV